MVQFLKTCKSTRTLVEANQRCQSRDKRRILKKSNYKPYLEYLKVKFKFKKYYKLYFNNEILLKTKSNKNAASFNEGRFCVQYTLPRGIWRFVKCSSAVREADRERIVGYRPQAAVVSKMECRVLFLLCTFIFISVDAYQICKHLFLSHTLFNKALEFQ